MIGMNLLTWVEEEYELVETSNSGYRSQGGIEMSVAFQVLKFFQGQVKLSKQPFALEA